MKPIDTNSVALAHDTVFSNLIPRPTSYDVVPVVIRTDSEVMKEFTSAFVDAVKSKLLTEGGALPVSENDIKLYLEYAVFARVRICMGKPSSLWGRYDKYRIPSFLAVCLAQIGRVERADLGIQLNPVWGEEVDPAIDAQTLGKVNSLFAVLENRGFEMVMGLPKDTSGSLQMMSLQVTEGFVKGTNSDAHPSMAVIASFFAVSGLASVLGAQAFRVSYGPVKQMAEYAWQVAVPKH